MWPSPTPDGPGAPAVAPSADGGQRATARPAHRGTRATVTGDRTPVARRPTDRKNQPGQAVGQSPSGVAANPPGPPPARHPGRRPRPTEPPAPEHSPLGPVAEPALPAARGRTPRRSQPPAVTGA